MLLIFILNGLFFSIVGLINWHFAFLFSLTVFIDCGWRLHHPRAVKGLNNCFICSHGGPAFLKNAVFSNPLSCCHLSGLQDPEERDLSPRLLKKNKSMPRKHHGRSQGQGAGGGPLHHWSQTNVHLVQRVTIPRFLHPILLFGLTISCTSDSNTNSIKNIRYSKILCWPQENSRLPFFALTRNIILFFFETLLWKPDKCFI